MNKASREQGCCKEDLENGPISEALERRIDDIESGRIKMVTYANADEYLKHLDAVLDE